MAVATVHLMGGVVMVYGVVWGVESRDVTGCDSR